MASVINTNMASLVAQRNLNSAQANLATSVQRLSSGLRINSGKDDAAGLAVASRMSSQARAMGVAARNANDGISMIQTADGVASTLSDIFLRMRDLATQAANDSLDSTQRSYIATEISELKTEADNMVNRTKFNGKALVNGSLGLNQASGSFAAGTVLSSIGAISNIDVSGGSQNTNYFISGSSGQVTLIASGGGQQTITLVSSSANTVQTMNFDTLGVKITLNLTNAMTATDISVALESAAGTSSPAITTSTSGAAALQVGADNATASTMSLDFMDMRITSGSNADFASLASKLTSFTANGGATRTNALNLMDTLDGAMTTLNTNRAKMGAWQNRLDFNVSSLNITEENTRASMSRIQDTDYAAETASLTKGQILQQAGAAMLSQANQMPNVILSLLK